MFKKKKSIIEEFAKGLNDSVEDLKNMSGFDLMNGAARFERELQRLINSQELPPSLVVSSLVNEAVQLCMKGHNLLVKSAFDGVKIYIDKNFVRKEKPRGEKIKVK